MWRGVAKVCVCVCQNVRGEKKGRKATDKGREESIARVSGRRGEGEREEDSR